jgi:hypothetical protein
VRERRIAISIFLLKWYLQSGSGQAAEPPAVGRLNKYKNRREAMKNEFIDQYGHAWRVFEHIVKGFDNDAWKHIGRKNYTPARISFHILHSIKYYLEDTNAIQFASGKSFEANWETAKEEDLPSQNDILICIKEIQARTELWLSEMDFTQENTSFEWAGDTKLGVVIFSLRHYLYHLGELSCLLNESRNGDVEDIYVKA